MVNSNLTSTNLKFFHQQLEVNKLKQRTIQILKGTTTNGIIYMTQLEGMLNKFDKQSNRYSKKDGTQIEPKEWH